MSSLPPAQVAFWAIKLSHLCHKGRVLLGESSQRGLDFLRTGIGAVRGSCLFSGLSRFSGNFLQFFAEPRSLLQLFPWCFSAFGRIDLGSLIGFSAPSGGGDAVPAVDGARAEGGPTKAGGTYLDPDAAAAAIEAVKNQGKK